MNSIKVFSPASVSNVCCGFDVLGFSIDGLGDEIIIHKSDLKGVRINNIYGILTYKKFNFTITNKLMI